ERDIFEYFAEEVFSAEPPEIQHYLTRVALLDRIEVDTCGRLYPEMISAAVLPQLVRGNVFMTVASDGSGEEYRLHPLFQSFLRRRLRTEIGRAGVAIEHLRCAQYFAGRQLWEPAAHHYIAAEDFYQAAKLIAERGGKWIASGALGSLASLADAVPMTA